MHRLGVLLVFISYVLAFTSFPVFFYLLTTLNNIVVVFIIQICVVLATFGLSIIGTKLTFNLDSYADIKFGAKCAEPLDEFLNMYEEEIIDLLQEHDVEIKWNLKVKRKIVKQVERVGTRMTVVSKKVGYHSEGCLIFNKKGFSKSEIMRERGFMGTRSGEEARFMSKDQGLEQNS